MTVLSRIGCPALTGLQITISRHSKSQRAFSLVLAVLLSTSLVDWKAVWAYNSLKVLVRLART